MPQVLSGTSSSPDQLTHYIPGKTGQAVAAQPLPWELKTTKNPRASPLPGYKLPGTPPSSILSPGAAPSPGAVHRRCLAWHSAPQDVSSMLSPRGAQSAAAGTCEPCRRHTPGRDGHGSASLLLVCCSTLLFNQCKQTTHPLTAAG